MSKPRAERKIAFLFTSSREGLLERVRMGEEPDTALRGLNHLAHADIVNLSEARHWLFLVPRLLRYDAVVASDALPLGFLVSLLGRLRRRRTCWGYVAMTTSTLLRRNAKRPLKRFALRLFWKSYGQIVCLSSAQKGDLLQIGIPSARLAFVPFGIDAGFYGAAPETPQGEFVLSVGRDAGRDYAALLAAARRTEHPFIIVASHRVLPQEVELPPNVSVRYNVPAQELRTLYGQARLVVVASKPESEPVGSDCSGQTVALDALAAGKPVVATERSWITDYLVPGEDLVVVPPGDPASLAAAIELLLQDPALAAHLAASGQGKVRSRYTTEAFARSLLNLIENSQ